MHFFPLPVIVSQQTFSVEGQVVNILGFWAIEPLSQLLTLLFQWP